MKTTHEDDSTDWVAQRDALRALHREVLDEPVPPALLAAATRSARYAGLGRWARWGGVAAAVALAFAAGWIANGQWSLPPQGGATLARVGNGRVFAHDAAVAHAVYSPEKRHPVEVAASEQQHLVQWLSKRLDRPLKVPDLSARGYALVGGRLLPGEDGARAQFMFEDPAGQRITLYIGAVEGQAATAASARETAFRFASDAPVPSFYWIDQGFGYAITGKLPREALLGIATLVYQQL